MANLAAGFDILAMALAAIGLYGASDAADAGDRDPHGLGIEAASTVWLVAKEAPRLVAIGCAAGMRLALAGGRLITAQLFGASILDPMSALRSE